MTPEEQRIVDAVTAKITGHFPVGARVRFIGGTGPSYTVGTVVAHVGEGHKVDWGHGRATHAMYRLDELTPA